MYTETTAIIAICCNQQSYANNAQVTKNRENPVKSGFWGSRKFSKR